jgi:F-type H+-transporting ATPase subunit a
LPDQAATETVTTADRMVFVKDWITEHLANSHKLHLPLLGEKDLGPVLTRHEVHLFWIAGLLVFIFVVLYRKKQRVPTGLTNALEAAIVFIRDEICISAMGEVDGRRFTPFFCTLFFLILSCNLIALIPVFPAVTANINLTAALAIMIFLLMTVGGLIKCRGPLGFIKAFILPGVPWPLMFLTVPLELIGILVKSFALAVRLFANMLGGHIIVMAFLGLMAVYGIVALPAFFVAVFIDVFEVLVAVLQAYIFVLLSAIFIGQIYHPEH